MKNATRLHKRAIVGFLEDMGCASIKFEEESIIALRSGKDGRTYPLVVDIYEEDDRGKPGAPRYRVRAARRFGLPVTYHHGEDVLGALEGIQWATLDRSLTRAANSPLSGVL
jgi:hypothetical protein